MEEKVLPFFFVFFVAVVKRSSSWQGVVTSRSADPSVSGSFGWNQSRFKGFFFARRVLCVCLIMRVEEPSISSRWMATQLGSLSPFQYVTKEVDGRRFPLIGRNFRPGCSSASSGTLLYSRMSMELFAEISRCFSLHFPEFLHYSTAERESKKKCENESAPPTYFPREIFNQNSFQRLRVPPPP